MVRLRKPLKVVIWLAATAAACTGLSGTGLATRTVWPAPAQLIYSAAKNYQMHCEGCHQADGSGQVGFIPDFRNNVAQFVAIKEGRAYLASVPGMAQSLLSDAERAEVLNWIVTTFDAAHLPPDFAPYTAAEVGHWRSNALSQPTIARAKLLARLDGDQSPAQSAATTLQAAASEPPATTAPVKGPAAFAVCGACHTVSPDGSNGIGPNLRGVVGRRAGSKAGFAYSPAMARSGLEWTRTDLDAFLSSPSTRVPGNMMSLAGIEDAADRQAIIAYLATLR